MLSLLYTLLALRNYSRGERARLRLDFPRLYKTSGAIALTRQGVGYQVRVNWLTGGVEVVPVN